MQDSKRKESYYSQLNLKNVKEKYPQRVFFLIEI